MTKDDVEIAEGGSSTPVSTSDIVYLADCISNNAEVLKDALERIEDLENQVTKLKEDNHEFKLRGL